MAIADFVVRQPNGRVVLVAEAKNKRHTTKQWATEIRRNLMAHFPIEAPYFLLATPDRFYFWLDQNSSDAIPPSMELESDDLLKPFIKTTGARDEHLSPLGFELIVSSWLRELVNSHGEGNRYPAELRRQTAFLDALRGASLIQQPNL